MKKSNRLFRTLAVLLTLIMALSLFTPAFYAAAEGEKVYPKIYLRGNGNAIVDEEGTTVYDFSPEKDQLVEMAKNILFPHFLTGLVTGNFDKYYDVFEAEIKKLYDRCSLDENGQPKYGTGISEWDQQQTEVSSRGQLPYASESLLFLYDWRLDPLANADKLNEHIDKIIAATGLEKVSLFCDCLGGVLIIAYLSKYGYDKIHAVGFGATVAFGSELVNDTFSGNLELDADAINRFMKEPFFTELFPESLTTVLSLIQASVDLAQKSGALETATDLFMKGLYKKLYKELVPRLTMATYGSWPSYWALIRPEDYESTKTFVFGKPGDARYEKYKNLITQLDNYDAAVRQRIPEILTGFKAAGGNLAIITKYGFELPPVLKSTKLNSDVWMSLKFASLGATVADIGETLSDAYIAQRTAAGFGKYISPDKQVDASTCLFPDYTWFIKNSIHNDGTNVDWDIMVRICDAQEQLTVFDMPEYPQFLVYDRENDTASPMTADNLHTESWDQPGKKTEKKNIFTKITDFFKSMIEWFKSLFAVAKQYIKF